MATLCQKYSSSWELLLTECQDTEAIFKLSRSLAPRKFLSNLKTKHQITSLSPFSSEVYRVNQNSVSSYSGLGLDYLFWSDQTRPDLIHTKFIIILSWYWAHNSSTLNSDSPCSYNWVVSTRYKFVSSKYLMARNWMIDYWVSLRTRISGAPSYIFRPRQS